MMDSECRYVAELVSEVETETMTGDGRRARARASTEDAISEARIKTFSNPCKLSFLFSEFTSHSNVYFETFILISRNIILPPHHHSPAKQYNSHPHTPLFLSRSLSLLLQYPRFFLFHIAFIDDIILVFIMTQTHYRRIAFVIDTTASMSQDIHALRTKILPEVIALSKLIDPFMKVLVLEYKDYDTPKMVTRSSGWLNVSSGKLREFLARLRPTGGADRAEATKTALNELLPNLDKETLVLHFADAEPHLAWHSPTKTSCREQFVYQGDDWDWCEISRKVHDECAAYYSLIRARDTIVFAAHKMLGRAFPVDSDPRNITNVAMSIILRETDIERNLAGMKEFHLESQQCPEDEEAIAMMVGSHGSCGAIGQRSDGTLRIVKKFKADEAYRSEVLDILISIFTEGDIILCLTTNALFGRLWNLCKGKFFEDKRLEIAKDALSKAAGLLTGKDREVFTAWQHASHNQVDVIKEMIEDMDKSARFPAYALDPAMATEIDIEVMLDVSRGIAKPADRKVIMKLLNSIVVVNSERELLRLHKPEDIEDDVPYVPLSLGKISPIKPFQFLPHLLVPGMIFGRSATMQLLLLAVNSETFAAESMSILQSRIGQWIKLSGFSAPHEKDQPNSAHSLHPSLSD